MAIDLQKTITNAAATAATVAANDPNTSVSTNDIPAVVHAATTIVAASPEVREAQSRIDYITNNESPFQSWGNAAGVTGTITALYGIVIALHDGFQPIEDQTLMITGIGAGISAALFFIGRWRGKPIGE